MQDFLTGCVVNKQRKIGNIKQHSKNKKAIIIFETNFYLNNTYMVKCVHKMIWSNNCGNVLLIIIVSGMLNHIPVLNPNKRTIYK